MDLGREALSKVEAARRQEWIITNGLGGYASSTVLGLNTRKYHGLLVAAFNPPVDRHVVVAKLDEQLLDGEATYPLHSNEFQGGIRPQGHVALERFTRFPCPTFTYSTHGVRLCKTVLMPYQQNAVIVSYEVERPSKNPLVLQVRPLLSFRHFHAVTEKSRVAWDLKQDSRGNKVLLRTRKPPVSLALASTEGQYHVEEEWVEGLFFRTDHEQGTSSFDDCLIPGRFETNLLPNTPTKISLVAAAAEDSRTAESTCAELWSRLETAGGVYDEEDCRVRTIRQAVATLHPAADARWCQLLSVAADSFIVNRASTGTKTIIAGYHWFEDWGRDSLISLPGLTLATHRFADARAILLTFKHYTHKGIIPNRFPDASGETPAYNTVDATLWFVNAVLQYVKYTNDFRFIKEELWAMLQSVIERHTQGTINNIHLDVDGLLAHGPQLTWMDAMINDDPVTPRQGKAVEIQALWYNAVRTMQLLAARFAHPTLAEQYGDMAHRTQRSFLTKFWREGDQYLADVVTDDAHDTSLRPNQIFAVSLDFSMLDSAQREAVVTAVQEKLVTPYGLRTLAREDSRYRGHYRGDWNARNFAYHNGTVWPWLTGPFVTAFTKISRADAQRRQFAFDAFLRPLLAELGRAGLGTLSEVYDGDPPHAPGGCISQAWSVAETLRAYVEDVLLCRPPFERKTLNDFRSEG
jgi:predicted glycogen debranching enzyme